MSNNQNNTTLLVMDMQTAMVNLASDPATLLSRTAQAIASARRKKIPVIYVVLGFRQGAPEISANNKNFMANKQFFTSASPTEFMTIHPDLAPHDNEYVIIKRRVSAFTGSDLEVVLRTLNMQHLVLTGISTSGVVLSTLREAADKDYRITVLSDACADREEEVHQFLTTRIFPRQAEVITVENWIG